MSEKKGFLKIVEAIVEKGLWNFRFIIFLGVIGLLVNSLIFFIIGISKTVFLVISIVTYIVENSRTIFIDGFTNEFYHNAIIDIIITVDDFLLGIVLLIFGLGTYDLFISKIDMGEKESNLRPDWLVFSSLDELKSVLGKVVLMILIINFLRLVVHIDSVEPIQLLYIGGGIALIALSLKLSHGNDINISKAKKKLGEIKDVIIKKDN